MARYLLYCPISYDSCIFINVKNYNTFHVKSISNCWLLQHKSFNYLHNLFHKLD